MKLLIIWAVMSASVLIANVDFTSSATYNIDAYGAPKEVKKEPMIKPHDIKKPRMNMPSAD